MKAVGRNNRTNAGANVTAGARAALILWRITTGVVLPFLLVLVALWVAIYFLLNGSWGLDYLRTHLPKGMAVEAFRVGPSPFSMRVSGVAFAGDGVEASSGRVSGVASLWPFGVSELDVDLDSLVVLVDRAPSADGAEQEDKVFSLAHVPAGELPFIGAFRGSLGSVHIVGATFGVFFRDVRVVRGEPGKAGPVALIRADRCEFADHTTGIAWGVSACGFELLADEKGPRYTLRAGLDDASGSTIQLEVLVFRDREVDWLEVRAELAISEEVAGLAAPGANLGNVAVRGLHIGPVPMSGNVERAEIRWNSIMFGGFAGRDVTVGGVAAGPGAVVVEPDGLLTRVLVELTAMSAANLRVFDVAVDDVRIARLAIDFDKRFDGALEGFAFSGWRSGDTHLGPGRGDFVLTAGITGGSLHGVFSLGEGVLGGSVSIKRSPLGGRVSIGGRFDGIDVNGALLAAFVRDSDTIPRDRRATIEGAAVAVEKGEAPGSTLLVADEMDVVIDGRRWNWDGVAWSGGEGGP